MYSQQNGQWQQRSSLLKRQRDEKLGQTGGKRAPKKLLLSDS
jgi:hypothetical protein